MPVHLSIISRQHNDLYDYLRERLAGDGDVRVIKDRRLGERRRKAAPAAAERRRAERRSRPEIDEQLRVRSHAIVTVSSEATPLRDTLTTAPGPVDVRRSLDLSTRARRYTQPSPKRRVGISVATADSAVPAGQGRGTNA